MTINRKAIGLGAILLAVVMFLQNQGWINIDVGPDEPEPEPKPPVTVPDETPDVPPVVPDVSTINQEILLAIEEESFPLLPQGLENVSLPIKQALVNCNDPNKALTAARVYADWELVIKMPWTAEEIKTFGQFREKHNKSIKGILAKQNLTVFCTGMGKMIDDVIASQVGQHDGGDSLSPEDYEKIAIAFRAISAQSYEAFKELVK